MDRNKNLNSVVDRLMDRLERQSEQIGHYRAQFHHARDVQQELQDKISELRNPSGQAQPAEKVDHDKIARVVEACIQFYPTNEKIKAIKEIRTITHLGLKEAKDVADALFPILNDLARKE